MIVLCRFSFTFLRLVLMIGLLPISSHAYAENLNLWESNPDIRQFTKPAPPQITYPFLDQIRGILNRSLCSPDQGRDLAALHASKGTRAQASYAKYVGPLKILANPQTGVEVRQALTKSMRLYAQKETKGDIFPQSWKDGLRFNIGGGAASAKKSNGFVYNGNPELRYGLRLTDIKPSMDSIKLASNGLDDYEILQYAPKADLVYEVGEVLPDGYARSYPTNIVVAEPAPRMLWQYLPNLPDVKFNGRMAPRGLPGPGSPLPPQSLFLDQTQGYYQMEAQLTGNLKQENVLHRFRMPVYGSMNYRQERNKDWIFIKSTFENIYSNDQGFAVHLERYHLEKRYQMGFQFHRAINHFELYAHIPDTALSTDSFWRSHRWETRFDLHF